MTKLTLEIKSDKDLALILSILRHFEIQVIEEEVRREPVKTSFEDFYGEFHFDLSNFKFDREEANAR